MLKEQVPIQENEEVESAAQGSVVTEVHPYFKIKICDHFYSQQQQQQEIKELCLILIKLKQFFYVRY